eukprot:357348-Chlamydomonas_euryale.AAC.2
MAVPTLRSHPPGANKCEKEGCSVCLHVVGRLCPLTARCFSLLRAARCSFLCREQPADRFFAESRRKRGAGAGVWS